jgi:hypothetical protein
MTAKKPIPTKSKTSGLFDGDSDANLNTGEADPFQAGEPTAKLGKLVTTCRPAILITTGNRVIKSIRIYGVEPDAIDVFHLNYDNVQGKKLSSAVKKRWKRAAKLKVTPVKELLG